MIYPVSHVLGWWEEVGVPGENPWMHMQNMDEDLKLGFKFRTSLKKYMIKIFHSVCHESVSKLNLFFLNLLRLTFSNLQYKFEFYFC